LALPFVPLVVGVSSAVAGVTGIATGMVGVGEIRKARAQIESDDARLGKCREAHRAKVDHTNVVLLDFGRTQELAQRDVIIRFEDFLVRNRKQVRAKKHLLLDGIDESHAQAPGLAKLDSDVIGWVQGLIGASAVGAATPVALRAVGTQLGKAGTGAAIKTLHGAAREKALVALFGGGPRTAGGLGMALGRPMLNAAGAGMGLLAAGVVVKTEGTRALTEAEARRTEADTEIAELRSRQEVLSGVRKLACEQGGVLGRLMVRATEALDVLESEPFDAELHAERFHVAFVLVKSVGQVLAAFYEHVNHDGMTEQLKFNYRDATTEATDD
jgi:hypothetical protein